MDSRPHESSWIDAGEPLSFAELGRACAMAPAELDELVEFGALVPLGLRSDFDLDLFTAGLLLRYLQRIESLERRVKSLEARLPVHAHHPEREGPDLWHEPRPAKAGVARS
jgi:chaperone modulatory protein CbpM